jgi:hypothetical protein
MKIKLLTQVAIAGTVRKVGDEVEVEKVVGNDLIHRKRAVSLEAPQAPQVINSDAIAPQVKRGRKKKAEAEAGGNSDGNNADTDNDGDNNDGNASDGE